MSENSDRELSLTEWVAVLEVTGIEGITRGELEDFGAEVCNLAEQASDIDELTLALLAATSSLDSGQLAALGGTDGVASVSGALAGVM